MTPFKRQTTLATLTIDIPDWCWNWYALLMYALSILIHASHIKTHTLPLLIREFFVRIQASTILIHILPILIPASHIWILWLGVKLIGLTVPKSLCIIYPCIAFSNTCIAYLSLLPRVSFQLACPNTLHPCINIEREVVSTPNNSLGSIWHSGCYSLSYYIEIFNPLYPICLTHLLTNYL